MMMMEDIEFVRKWVKSCKKDERSHDVRFYENSRPTSKCSLWNSDLYRLPLRGDLSLAKRKICRTKSSYLQQRKHSSASHGILASEGHKRGDVKRRWPPNLDCNLRIAELALPTKRQCMETWRNNYDTLPAYMIERLQEHIMNETATHQISDAINCFRRCKNCPLKRKNGGNKKLKRNTFKETQLKKLCTLFGKKVAEKLARPRAIKLNPELRKISNVIATELFVIHKNKKCSFDQFDEKMLNEFSEKITVWVAIVLEEASNKLLEEDLRDLEEEEGAVLNLIDDVLEIAMTKSINDSNDADKKQPSIPTFEIEPITGSTHEINKSDTSELYIKQFNDAEMILVYMQNDTIAENISNDDKNEENNDNVIGKDSMSIQLKMSKQQELNIEEIDVDNEHISKSYIKYIDDKESIHSQSQMRMDIRNIINSIIFDINTGDSEDITESDLHLRSGQFISNQQLTDEIEVRSLEETNDSSSKNNYFEAANDNSSHIQIIITSIIDDITNSNKIGKDPENSTDDSENKVKNQIKTIIDNIINATINEGELENIMYNDDNIDYIAPLNYDQNSLQSESITTQVHSSNIPEVTLDDPAHSEGSQQDNVHDVSGYMNKKVKFSQTDLVFLNQSKDSKENSTLGTENVVNKILNSSNHDINKIFLPPNNNLLRSVDESWPSHIPMPKVKITASVSKSITSLGKILESDEKLSLLSYTDDIFNERQILDGKYIGEERNFKTPEQEICHENFSVKSFAVKANHHDTQKQKKDVKQQKIVKQSENTYTYKSKPYQIFEQKKSCNENLQLILKSLERNLAHEPNTAAKPSSKINRHEIKLWCKNIERIFYNLDMWIDWFEALTEAIRQLMQRTEHKEKISKNIKRINAIPWTKLKMNVDSDAVLWKQLNIKVYKTMTKYNEMMRAKALSSRRCCNCQKIQCST